MNFHLQIHLQNAKDNSLMSKVLKWEVKRSRKVGRPKLSWLNNISKDLPEAGLTNITKGKETATLKKINLKPMAREVDQVRRSGRAIKANSRYSSKEWINDSSHNEETKSAHIIQDDTGNLPELRICLTPLKTQNVYEQEVRNENVRHSKRVRNPNKLFFDNIWKN